MAKAIRIPKPIQFNDPPPPPLAKRIAGFVDEMMTKRHQIIEEFMKAYICQKFTKGDIVDITKLKLVETIEKEGVTWHFEYLSPKK